MKKFSLVILLVLLTASNAFANCTAIYVNGVPSQVCGDNVNSMRSSNDNPFANTPIKPVDFSSGYPSAKEREETENLRLQNEVLRKQLGNR